MDYAVVEVNPLTKSEISFSKDYRKVPIAKFGDTQVNDSTQIINYITDHYAKSQSKKYVPQQTVHYKILVVYGLNYCIDTNYYT